MKNRKFALLVNEFAQMIGQSAVSLERDQGLICHYQGCDLRIEEGQRIGLSNQIVVLAVVGQKVASKTQVKINGSFALSKDGYLAEIKKLGCCLVRHIPMPEHPRTLLEEVNNSLTLAKQIRQEIESNVAR